MTLAERLVNAVPSAGLPMRQLRREFSEIAPCQLDAAIQGLIMSGVFRLALGIVTAPLRIYPAPPPPRRTMATRLKKFISPEQLEMRSIRKRMADAEWRAKNRDKIRAYHRAYVPLWRARRRAALADACI